MQGELRTKSNEVEAAVQRWNDFATESQDLRHELNTRNQEVESLKKDNTRLEAIVRELKANSAKVISCVIYNLSTDLFEGNFKRCSPRRGRGFTARQSDEESGDSETPTRTSGVLHSPDQLYQLKKCPGIGFR